ncbi:MAG: hypothetical protein Fur005_05990 [Roseiflexaceae bacterium]
MKRRRTDWIAWFVVGLIACQYAALQLWLDVQQHDGPRNLHWGLYVLEEPGFLLTVEDHYSRVVGYPPPSPEMAPMGLANGRSYPLHPWWGPTYVLLVTFVWVLTHSYTAIQLITPVLAGALIVLTYCFGRTYTSVGWALLGAAMLGLFPNFRETAVIALVEPISALLLLISFWAWLERRWWLTALAALIALFGKIDMIVIYLGVIGLMTLLPEVAAPRRTMGAWVRALRWRALIQPAGLITLWLPGILITAWVVFRYGILGIKTTVWGSPSPRTFSLQVFEIIDQFFLISRPLAYTGLALLVVLAVVGALRGAAPLRVRQLLGIWFGLGVFILLVYCATPGASNNPRVFIPGLPPMILLVVLGLQVLAKQTRLISVALLGFLYAQALLSTTLDLVTVAQRYATFRPVIAELRTLPQGVTMTDLYWHAVLYARQPATWFESDEVFGRSILRNQANFQAYLESTPIRYVIFPTDEREIDAYMQNPWHDLQVSLPFGRAAEWNGSYSMITPDIREYLERFPKRRAGFYTIYIVRDS